MKTKYFAFDETYELDNVYNLENDELYADKSAGDASSWYN